jgi:hypothetical protein
MIRHSLGMRPVTEDHMVYYCHQCGNGLGNDARFCGACGTPRPTARPATSGSTTAAGSRTLVEPAARMARPAGVTWTVGLFFAFAVVFVAVWILVIAMSDTKQTPGDFAEIALVFLAPAVASALLAVFVAEGSRVANVATLVFGGLAVVSGVALVPEVKQPLDLAFVLVLFLLAVPAVLVLVPQSRSFARSTGATSRPATTSDRALAYGRWGVILFWLGGIPAIVLGMLSLKRASLSGGARFVGRASISHETRPRPHCRRSADDIQPHQDLRAHCSGAVRVDAHHT